MNKHLTVINAFKRLALQLALLTSPVATYASTEYQSLDQVVSAVNEYLLNRDEIRGYPDTEVRVHRLDKRLKLSRCDALHVNLTSGARLIGKTSVEVSCNKPKPWRFYVNATISRYENVYALSGSLNRGHIIGLQDIYKVRKDLARLPYGYITDASELVGMELKRNMLAGRILSPSHLRKPVVIKRGEMVSIQHRATGFTVRMQGTAMASGAVGERIRVKNSSSKRVIEAVIAQSGLVYTE